MRRAIRAGIAAAVSVPTGGRVVIAVAVSVTDRAIGLSRIRVFAEIIE